MSARVQSSQKMPSRFRIFELPDVVLKDVFQNFEGVEILDLSFTSTRLMRRVFRSVGLRAVSHTVKFEDAYPLISTIVKFGSGKGSETSFVWKFVEGKKSINSDKVRKVECHRFDNCFTKGNTIFCHYHNPELGATVIFNHIFNCLPAPLNLHLKLNSIKNLHALFLNDCFSTCEKLDVWYVEQDENDELVEDLTGILEMVDVKKELRALVPQQCEMDIEKIRDLEVLTIQDAEWMSLPALYSLNCRFGSLLNHKFGQFDISAFAENWYNSTDRKLVKMQFGWNEYRRFSPMIDNLNWKEWDPKIRSRYFHDSSERSNSSRIDCSKGLDITRPDGLTATILKQDAFDCNILFLVWHDIHPETTRLAVLSEKLNLQNKKLASILGNRKERVVKKEFRDTFTEALAKKTEITEEIKLWVDTEDINAC
ncbi:hypothetical protein L5515_011114 [Caenorhabditis briggsae]|uniref:F-box domain-containing protein n=1 Tax=Caenorhabditis briggsae TaxID=6238 RepID=A0AAE9EUP4_CAEBR|nr:hypothetical protein L5515_011114 [Caenorhabditis briggsae]